MYADAVSREYILLDEFELYSYSLTKLKNGE